MSEDFSFIKFLSCPQDKGTLRVAPDSAQCRECGRSYRLEQGRIYFSFPPKDIIASGSNFKSSKSSWSKWRQANFIFFEKYLKNEDTDKVFIDIGAGISQFQEITSKFKNAVRMDFYPYPLINVVADMSTKFPLRTGVSDIIFISNVLEHVFTPHDFLQECHRVLKPGGFIVGTVPFLIGVHQAPYDYYRYTNFMLEKLFSGAGFNNIAIEIVGKPFDVFETMQRQFFSGMMAHSDSLGPWNRLIMSLGRRAVLGVTKLFSPVFELMPVFPKYVSGYGFYAKK